jgi:hypothetical protein
MSAGSLRSGIRQYLEMGRGLAWLMGRVCTPESARALIRARLEKRERLFLQMVREAIWPNPRSPYYHLLAAAGWTDETLADAVQKRGVEAALRSLRDSGVYLTHAEFKERKPIERNGLRLEWDNLSVHHPRVSPAFEVRTGGTRSRGDRVPATFAYLASQRAPTWCLTLEAVGGGSWPAVIWMPREASLLWWLTLASMRRPAVRWFTMVDFSYVRIPQLHLLMYRLGQAAGLLHGLRLPYIEYAPLSAADVVYAAVGATRARHGGCSVITTPSGATRLAGVAGRLGHDLERVAFVVGAEPLTPGKYAEIVGAGARVGVRYNITEIGAIGGACGRPEAADDVHLLADSFGFIPDRRRLPDGQAVDGLMLTTLLPSSPMALLNLDSDDFAEVATRRCGCLWDELGLHTHLSKIRSFSKLTGEGVTVLGTECVRIIEEVLPREFGGRSTDYQLLEVEDDQHLTRLHLVVSPSVGPVDEEKVLARFQQEIKNPVPRGDTLPPMWRQADTIKVVRREPVPTAAGKLLPFHTLAFVPGRAGERRGAPTGGGSGGPDA